MICTVELLKMITCCRIIKSWNGLFPFKLGKVGQIEFWQQKNSVIMLFHNVQCFLEFMISHSKECIKAKKNGI